MTLPAALPDWPGWAVESLAERIAIMESDDVPDAEAKARACVEREASCESS